MNKAVQTLLTTSALLLAAVLLLANVVAATCGLDSIRMIQTFSMDEGIAVSRMKDNLERFSIDPDGFFYYGNLYHSIAYFCIVFFERFGWTIDTALAGFVLRMVSIVSALLACLSLWKVSKNCYLPTAIASGVALALLTMPDFVVFSRTMHPDTLQTLFIVIGLGLALLRPTFSFALISAVAAGLAFSTKYVGLVALPFSFLPLAFSTLGREQWSRQVLLRLFLQSLAMIGAFVGIFTLTNPYAAFDRSRFFSVFMWQMRYSANGAGVAAPANPLLWLDVLNEQFGTIGLVYLFGGFFLACAYVLRDVVSVGWRSMFIEDDRRSRLVLVLYVLASSAHLAISVYQREARFTYHVVPFIVLLSTLALLDLISGLSNRIARPNWINATFATLLLVFGATQISLNLRAMAAVTTKPDSEVIKFGDFVAQRYPSDSRILADPYAYVPSSMTNVIFTNLQTEEMLNEVKPQLIILTLGATGQYVWKKSGSSFSEKKFIRNERYPATSQVEKHLNKLLAPSSGWSVVRESDSELLLQRSQ